MPYRKEMMTGRVTFRRSLRSASARPSRAAPRLRSPKCRGASVGLLFGTMFLVALAVRTCPRPLQRVGGASFYLGYKAGVNTPLRSSVRPSK
jgi:hypothetical protein